MCNQTIYISGGGGGLNIGDTIGNSPIPYGVLAAGFDGKLTNSTEFRLVTGGSDGVFTTIPITITIDDLQETDATGLLVTNDTPATDAHPIQLSPAIIMQGTGSDGMGGPSSTQSCNWYLKPDGSSDLRPYMYVDFVIDGVRTSDLFSIGITGYTVTPAGYKVLNGSEMNTDGIVLVHGDTISIATGQSDSTAGTATLSSGTVTVSTTAIATGDMIFLSANTSSGTVGLHYEAPVASIVNGTSFVINSVSAAGVVVATDNSTINWWIIKNA